MSCDYYNSSVYFLLCTYHCSEWYTFRNSQFLILFTMLLFFSYYIHSSISHLIHFSSHYFTTTKLSRFPFFILLFAFLFGLALFMLRRYFFSSPSTTDQNSPDSPSAPSIESIYPSLNPSVPIANSQPLQSISVKFQWILVVSSSFWVYPKTCNVIDWVT